MLEISQPKVDLTVSGHNYGRFTIEPLEPGYGVTMGNALRRILLRSLPGTAIVRARIADVWHEFSTIEGVREDVTEIVLNLKRIRIRSIGPINETRAHLYHEGKGAVTAGDVDWPSDVEVVNPELVIATVDSDDATIEMDLVVASGRGYQPAEAQEAFSIGEIPLDALFTPIEKVNYVVEHTRVGQMTDFDSLIIEIVTDGTIEPDDALSQAAEILVQHARMIAGFNRADALAIEDVGVSPSEADTRALAELGLSPRVLNALRSRQIERVGQVMAMERDQLLAIRNFGPRSLRELTDALTQHGYEIPATLAGNGGDADADGGDSQLESVAADQVDEETGS
ncbi:MAG TPA: DNA-directed RNA polymerase subunit alpha [Thermomicrobiales bacterium]|nr:DNA-directed RNA polymerase subunit alpha [Thermomicrobiales bacterium]